jgi:hypothetical protein
MTSGLGKTRLSFLGELAVQESGDFPEQPGSRRQRNPTLAKEKGASTMLPARPPKHDEPNQLALVKASAASRGPGA